MSWGLIQIYTGNGKGKTSAALGVALRAAATGHHVAIVSFDKGGSSHYSERNIIRERLPMIDLYPVGRDRIDPVSNRFDFSIVDADRQEGERGIAIVRQLYDGHCHDLIVLDEICSSASLGIVSESSVLAILDQKPKDIELILTGRNASSTILERADLVTEMCAVKHYFDRGVSAREGLDF